MNPAHIIYECLTDRTWGRGYSSAEIDDASFRAAADTLYAENFGLSILWDQQQDIEAFIDAKREPGRLRMFNLSVLVSDAFMEAVAKT